MGVSHLSKDLLWAAAVTTWGEGGEEMVLPFERDCCSERERAPLLVWSEITGNAAIVFAITIIMGVS